MKSGPRRSPYRTSSTLGTGGIIAASVDASWNSRHRASLADPMDNNLDSGYTCQVRSTKGGRDVASATRSNASIGWVHGRRTGVLKMIIVVSLAVATSTLTSLAQAAASTDVIPAGYTFSPNPIGHALPEGTRIELTLTSKNSSGGIAANARVRLYLRTLNPAGRWVGHGQDGTLTVNSTPLICGNQPAPDSCTYRTNAQGLLTMTFTVGPGEPSGWTTVIGAKGAVTTVTATDTYTF